jgi:D-beta-D-heptose 7-phosphate kinase/D-beta-D-heptose 1-phosphate adenosyltransferase
MLDHFLYGSVERISPEAPVPVFNFKSEKKMLGGAGNVVANLSSLGCKADIICFIGKDPAGKTVRELLRDVCGNPAAIEVEGYPTIEKTRIIAGNNHILRIDTEKKFTSVGDADRIFSDMLEERIREADIVLLSDYAKGILSDQRCKTIIALCKKTGRKVLVDPKGDNYEKYRGASLIKPNLKEFCQAAGVSCSPDSPDFEQIFCQGAKRLFEHCGFDNLLVTLSEHGMAYLSASDPDDVFRIPTKAKEVFDVSGAGDTSLAAFGAALAAGAAIRDAMQLANIASGIAVGKLGTSQVSAAEMSKELASMEDRSDIWDQKAKVIKLDDARKLADSLHKQGKIIGFTNGCFDLLHQGHLFSLMRSKKHCDVLFIGLNTDASVRRLKGSERPVQDEDTRALLLSSLEFVDYVILFDDDTAIPLVEAVRPDVILKEGYTLDKWPEAQLVESYGGRAVTLPRLEGYSTTSTIARLRRSQDQHSGPEQAKR